MTHWVKNLIPKEHQHMFGTIIPSEDCPPNINNNELVKLLNKIKEYSNNVGEAHPHRQFCLTQNCSAYSVEENTDELTIIIVEDNKKLVGYLELPQKWPVSYYFEKFKNINKRHPLQLDQALRDDVCNIIKTQQNTQNLKVTSTGLRLSSTRSIQHIENALGPDFYGIYRMSNGPFSPGYLEGYITNKANA